MRGANARREDGKHVGLEPETLIVLPIYTSGSKGHRGLAGGGNRPVRVMLQGGDECRLSLAARHRLAHRVFIRLIDHPDCLLTPFGCLIRMGLASFLLAGSCILFGRDIAV